MNIPEPETPQVKTTPGTFASNKLSTLASSHPFTQRLEILFPENPALEFALAQNKACYAKGIYKLSELVENAEAFIHALESQSKFLMLSTEKNVDDAWCIDSRGIVTIFLSKETYEQFGIVGKQLPFKKRAKDERVVQFSLRKGTDTPGNAARRCTALTAWDKRREEEMGLSGWQVVYCRDDPGTISHPLSSSENPNDVEVREVTSHVRKLQGVYVPGVKLRSFPSASEEESEEWNEEIHGLFEWVGMACLGSQRLNLNDRVDPYVALYEPPPSKPGNLTHIQWQGLLCPAFVQGVIDTVISFLDQPEHNLPFVSIVGHSATKTPLAYISPKNTSLFPTASETLRVPKDDSEDSWCLYAKSRSTGEENIDWVLAESVDKLDTRWG
ncbi:hypothetical protein AX15_001638 [Amanita polypyramis BW_CC]|nr:hypothetical protein AX15_001638 [Amanita polypyramis BW_CC]